MQRNEKVPGCQGKRGREKRGEVKIRKWGRRVSKECRGCQDRRKKRKKIYWKKQSGGKEEESSGEKARKR